MKRILFLLPLVVVNLVSCSGKHKDSESPTADNKNKSDATKTYSANDSSSTRISNPTLGATYAPQNVVKKSQSSPTWTPQNNYGNSYSNPNSNPSGWQGASTNYYDPSIQKAAQYSYQQQPTWNNASYSNSSAYPSQNTSYQRPVSCGSSTTQAQPQNYTSYSTPSNYNAPQPYVVSTPVRQAPPPPQQPYVPQMCGSVPSYCAPQPVYAPPPACSDFCGPVCDSPCYPCCGFAFIPSIQYRGGRGLGYKRGYETAELFIASYDPCYNDYPFLDLKAHAVDKGDFAANVGLGWRFFTCNYDEMLGFNIYYDYRRVKHTDLQEIGLGFEYFGSCLDVHLNGYIPVGNKNALLSTDYFNYQGGFFARRKRFESSMWGIDLEVGKYLICCGCFDLYVGLGPYFYGSQCCNSFVGGRGRLEADIGRYLTLGMYITHDRYYNTTVQGEVILSLPFGAVAQCCECLFRPVIRNDIIVTEKLNTWKSNF